MRKRSDVGVALDFDGTLIFLHQALVMLLDTKGLTPEGTEVMRVLREKFLPKFHSGTITPADERAWLEGSVRTYIRFGLDMRRIRETLAGVRLKPGVLECLRRLSETGVPVGIVSYGCRQFIELVLRSNRARRYVDRIYAMDLSFAGDGRLIGFNPITTVTPTSKGIWSRHFAREFGIPKKNLLAVGDTHGDRFLGSLKKNRLGIVIGADSPRKLREVMGEIRDGADFGPATEWLFERIERFRRD